ncbi:MAG: nucleoside recognition domain-containing protein [Armatimonadota bacterium]
MKIDYSPAVEQTLTEICSLLEDSYCITPRSIALLLVQGDEQMLERVRRIQGSESAERIREIIHLASHKLPEPLMMSVMRTRQQMASKLCAEVMTLPQDTRSGWSGRIGRLCNQPLTGIPIMLIVLYFGLYKFVGVFGGGFLVDLLENKLFGQHINPVLNGWINHMIPWPWLQSLFTSEYGLIPLALTYSIALIMPIVGTFFFMFSILEDSGYLPRLAMLIDRLFKRVGLNGRSVIPIILGFGCDTMATMVTRVLETPRERLIATFLLALAIPCSAQMGVFVAVLSTHPGALLLWSLILVCVFLFTGWLASKVVPGEASSFHMELPSMRWPSIGNILAKTYSRMYWYFLEVLPLFFIASVVIWLAELAHIFQKVAHMLQPVMHLLGLPAAAADIMIFGFFRRDFGAAGLYHMHQKNLLDGVQVLVIAVTLTLFLPCFAQFMMMRKERGTKTALGIAAIILPLSIGVGTLLNWVLRSLGVSL